MLNTASKTLIKMELPRLSATQWSTPGGISCTRWNSAAEASAMARLAAGPAAATLIMSRRGWRRRAKLTGTGLA